MLFKSFIEKAELHCYSFEFSTLDMVQKSELERIAFVPGLTPSLEDLQNQFISREEIQKTAYDFIQTPMQVFLEHKYPIHPGDVRIVESTILRNYDYRVSPTGLIPDYQNDPAAQEELSAIYEMLYSKPLPELPPTGKESRGVIAKSQGNVMGKLVRKGTWVIGIQFLADKFWEYYMEGNIVGVSVHGPALHIPVIEGSE